MWTIGIILVIVVLAIPAVRRFLGSFLTGAVAFVGGGLAIVAWLSIVIVVFCSAIGADLGSWKAGALFGAIMAFFLTKKIGGAISVLFRRTPATATGSFLTSLLTSVAVIAALLMFGIPERIAPEITKSSGRLARNAKQGIANSMDDRSSKSEREAGKFALVRENVVLTDSATGGEPVGEATVGMVVRVLDLNTERVASEESEGKLRVMLPNKFKGYDQGQTGFIPTRALDFNWEKKYTTDRKDDSAFSDPSVECIEKNPKTGGCLTWQYKRRG